MVPPWLHDLSIGFLALGIGCAIIIAVDAWCHPQQMWIMNVVWPLTALFGTVIWLWGYFHFGRLAASTAQHGAHHGKSKPFPVMVAEAASHCGSGCTLGDICAEWLAFGLPAVAIWLGWHSLFSEKIFAIWILDYIFAYAIGIVFQYYTIAPMRRLKFSVGVCGGDQGRYAVPHRLAGRDVRFHGGRLFLDFPTRAWRRIEGQ